MGATILYHDPPSLDPPRMGPPGMGPPGMGPPGMPPTRTSHSGGGREELWNMSTQQIRDFVQKKEAREAEVLEAKLKQAKLEMDTKMFEAESARIDYERVLGDSTQQPAPTPAPAPALARAPSPACCAPMTVPTPVPAHGLESVHPTDAKVSESGLTAREKGKGDRFPSMEAVEQATRRQVEEAKKATRDREAQARQDEEMSEQMASDLKQLLNVVLAPRPPALRGR
eukprot:7652660-Pyramimonas_sp.AAC.2